MHQEARALGIVMEKIPLGITELGIVSYDVEPPGSIPKSNVPLQAVFLQGTTIATSSRH